ncbi:MAG: inaA protein [Methylophaga sp.]|nr:inaA protein [Methylophaga sp.]
MQYPQILVYISGARTVSKLLLTDDSASQKSSLNFDSLWHLYTNWFEEPNVRRGGWSGVIKQPIQVDSGAVEVFIKRQENHSSKTLLHPFKGQATFYKEYRNIRRLTKKNIPALNALFFGQRGMKAILVTKALTDYQPLDIASLKLDRPQKRALLTEVAKNLRLMHQHHYQHNCLYPKHIFVKYVNGAWRVRFIDLEKLKWQLFKKNAIHRDLITLYRHSGGNWSEKDRLFFFRAYQQEAKLSNRSKKLWRKLQMKNATKSKMIFTELSAT